MGIMARSFSFDFPPISMVCIVKRFGAQNNHFCINRQELQWKLRRYQTKWKTNRKKVTIRKNTCVKEPSGDYKIRRQPRGMTQAGDTIPRSQNLSRELVARFPPPLQRAITSLCKLKPRCATWFLEKVPVPEGGLEGKAKSLGFFLFPEHSHFLLSLHLVFPPPECLES